MRTKAEMGVMQLQPPKKPGAPGAGRGKEGRLQREYSTCWHLDLGFLTPRTVSEYICFFLSHSICGNLLQQLQETNTRTNCNPPPRREKIGEPWSKRGRQTEVKFTGSVKDCPRVCCV